MPYSNAWWQPEAHAARRPFLLARGALKRGLQNWFINQGFVEVDTACLQVSPGNETHLHAFKTELIATDLAHSRLYLATSPEFAAKKLLAAGEARIFTFAHVFRNRERGPLHHPEFMMLEWYRTNETYEAAMRDCAALLAVSSSVINVREFRWRDSVCDPTAEPERLAVADAFARYAGIDLLSCVTATETDRDLFAVMAGEAGIDIPADYNFGDIFSRVLTEKIEPHLGRGRATLLHDYPVSQAALAQPKSSDPRVAERFELYVAGVEVANGFGELTDPTVQRWRFEAEMEEKKRIYGEAYPIDEGFLHALAMTPPATGVALGFDRLVMLATHAERIEKVMWTPVAAHGSPL